MWDETVWKINCCIQDGECVDDCNTTYYNILSEYICSRKPCEEKSWGCCICYKKYFNI
jgi:hypothetical protein